MGIGVKRTRNWGKDAQEVSLALILESRNVAYKTAFAGTGQRRREVLFLTGSKNGVALPFLDGVADLIHVRRGRWEARHPFDGRLLATGISHRDVIRATIQAIWH